MTGIIKITENDGKQLVSARELHEFLEINTKFNDWINRMFDYGFENEVDYILLKNEKNKVSKSNPIDYALTLDCSKEISMLQRSEKGKQARKYFIECEKKLKEVQLSPKQLAYMVIEAEEKAERLQLEIKTKHEPRSQFIDKVFESKTLITMGQVAKTLQLGFGRNTLFKKLREKGILFKSTNEPKQIYIDKGYFEVKEKVFSIGEEVTHIKLQTYVTQKGLGFIAKTFEVVQVPIIKTNFLSA